MKRNGINKVKRMLGAGVWIDANGNGHMNIPDILKELGIPDTPENHQMAVDMCAMLLKKEGRVPLYRKSADDPGTPV